MSGINIYALYERLSEYRRLDPITADLILRKILDIMDTGNMPNGKPEISKDKESENVL